MKNKLFLIYFCIFFFHLFLYSSLYSLQDLAKKKIINCKFAIYLFIFFLPDLPFHTGEKGREKEWFTKKKEQITGFYLLFSTIYFSFLFEK